MSVRDVIQAAAGASAPSDPNFKNVSLLLSGDGTNGAQNNTFLDSSTNNFTITRNGNTTQGTFSPYGSLWSNYFDGNGDYLTAPNNAAFVFGSGDFTIECWVFNSTTSEQYVYARTASAGAGTVFGINSTGKWVGAVSTNGTTNISVASSSNATINVWTHLALTRSGTTLTLWVNGSSVSTNTVSGSLHDPASTSYIAVAFPGVLFGYVTGYISNLRVVKGTAVYTSNFTPSTTPLTAVSGTSLLTCQSNRFIDNSSNNFTLTVNGNTSVQRFSPFNPTAPYSAATIGGSGYFDGSGDYLSVPNNTALNLTSGDWTIEAWIYPVTSASMTIIDKDGRSGSTAPQYNIDIENNLFRGTIGDGTGLSAQSVNGATVQVGAWNHVAFVKEGSSLSTYQNGIRTNTVTQTVSMVANTRNLNVGWVLDASVKYFNGYISNARVVKGTALYSGTTYTVPTSPLTAITNTSLLLNFTNAGIPDAAMMNDLETVGNAQVSTSVKKYGTGSLYFDGTGDYLNMPSTPNMSLGSGDFTIEGWLYPSSQPGSFNAIVGSSATGGPILNLRGSGTSTSIGLNSYGSGDIFNISYTFTQNTWVHVAVSRSGTSLKLFINGTQTGSTVTNSTNFSGYITSVGMADNGNQFYNGYIDDLRITKGLARYTSNFTPPAQALPTN